MFRDELKKSFQLRREGEEGRDCLEKRTGEFLWVSVDDSLNVFFLETWETGGGWFHRVDVKDLRIRRIKQEGSIWKDNYDSLAVADKFEECMGP